MASGTSAPPANLPFTLAPTPITMQPVLLPTPTAPTPTPTQTTTTTTILIVLASTLHLGSALHPLATNHPLVNLKAVCTNGVPLALAGYLVIVPTSPLNTLLVALATVLATLAPTHSRILPLPPLQLLPPALSLPHTWSWLAPTTLLLVSEMPVSS